MRKSAVLGMVAIAVTVSGGAAHAATTTPVATWTKIANQSAPFTVTDKKIVRFGTGTQWVTRVTGSGQCTAAFFGKDPAVGKTKQCEVWALGPPKSYSVKLNWVIPTTRQNGKSLALSELKGYEVYYATDNDASTANDTVIAVSGGATNSSVISQLPAGIYYFSVAAIDVNGLKSPLSTMVTASLGVN